MSVKIDFVTEYDGRALGKANKDINALASVLTTAKRSFIGLLAFDKLAQFTTDSVNAYARQEKSLASLNASLTALGLGFEKVTSEKFIHDLSLQTGIVSEQLIPSYQKLIQTTASVDKSQAILKASIAAASGGLVTAEEAATALTQAYLGNKKGVKSLELGLNNAQIASMNFEQILQTVNDVYANSLIAQTETYASKLDKLSIASTNAKEAFGKGILNVFSQMAGNGDIDAATSKVERFGQVLGAAFETAFTPVKAGKFYLPIPNLSKFNSILRKNTSYQTPANQVSSHNTYAAQQKIRDDAAAKKKAQQQAAILAQSKAQNKLSLNNLKLQKAAAIFDMKKIQITAALKSAYDEETVTRLKLMLAIENEQGDAAAALQKKLDEIIAKNKSLQTDLNAVTSGVSAINALSAQPFIDMVTLASRLGMTIPETQALLDTLAKTPNPFGPMLDSANQLSRVLPSIIDQSGQLTSRALRTIPDAAGLALDSTGAGLNPTVGTTPTTTTATPTQVNVTVNGAIDPVSTANQISQILNGAAGSTGTYTGLGYSWLQALGLAP